MSQNRAAGGLDRLLPEGTRPPSTIPKEVFRAAAAMVLGGQRLDMRRLATEAGISRATLYRWVGSRDALLGEVFWWLARHAQARALAASSALTGRDRVLASLAHFLTTVRADPALLRFLASEPEVAMRVLTSQAAGVQRGTVDMVERLLAEESDAGRLPLSLDRGVLAYVIVRVSESILYADVIAGRSLDVEQAVTVVRQLLAPPPT